MFGLSPGAHHWRGVVCDDRVRQGSIGHWKGGSPSGGVGHCWFDESDEIMRARLLVVNLQKEGVRKYARIEGVSVWPAPLECVTRK